MSRTGVKAGAVDRLRRALGVGELEREVAELRAEVEDYRNAHLRFAELVDVVTELLLPSDHQDRDRIERLLVRYTDDLDQES